MNDDQAEQVFLAVQELALVVRDEGDHARVAAAQRVLDLAGGDAVAALILAGAAINPNAPMDLFWQDTPAALKRCSGCGESKTISEFRVDTSRNDGLTYQCRECLAHHGRLYRRRAA